MMKSSSQSPVLVKHILQRTCVACRRVRPKPELVRLVRIPDGSVKVDASGKEAGRGAYLCSAPECWQIGLKGNRLEHALHTQLTQDNREQLIRHGNDLKESISGEGE